MAYKLQLPKESPIHPVFHVAQLWKAIENVSLGTPFPCNPIMIWAIIGVS